MTDQHEHMSFTEHAQERRRRQQALVKQGADLLANPAAYRRLGATREEAEAWSRYDTLVLERMEKLENELGRRQHA